MTRRNLPAGSRPEKGAEEGGERTERRKERDTRTKQKRGRTGDRSQIVLSPFT